MIFITRARCVPHVKLNIRSRQFTQSRAPARELFTRLRQSPVPIPSCAGVTRKSVQLFVPSTLQVRGVCLAWFSTFILRLISWNIRNNCRGLLLQLPRLQLIKAKESWCAIRQAALNLVRDLNLNSCNFILEILRSSQTKQTIGPIHCFDFEGISSPARRVSSTH